MKFREPEGFWLDDWRVSPLEGVLIRDSERVRLEPRTMEVLVYLASRPGEVITREALEKDVWRGAVVGYEAVTNTVIKLRKAFGDDARHPRIIETLPKRGYRLLAPVRPLASPVKKPVSTSTEPAVSGVTAKSHWRWWTAGLVIVLATVAISMLILETQRPSGSDVIGDRERIRLVVLPFQNLSETGSQDYFSNGLTDDLITELSGIPGLAVIANDSSFVYEGDEVPGRLREELNIQYVLRGSVRKEAGRVRINVQLIDAALGRYLWAERYDEKLADTFTVQDSIVKRIATSLEVSVHGAQPGLLPARHASGIEAYDHFLRGKERYSRRTRSDLQIAEQHFQRAIALDPGFARAHASLALVHLRDVMDAWNVDPVSALQRAHAGSNQAIELDNALPEAHFASAVVALFQRRYEQAIDELDRAISLRPSYADAYASLAWVLHFAGRPEGGRPYLETAIQLNPHVAASYLLIDGGIAFTLGETQTAVIRLEQAMDMSPTHPRILLWLAAAYARAGRLEEANWIIQELQLLHPSISLSRLDHAFPFRDAVSLQQLKNSLREAGLTE